MCSSAVFVCLSVLFCTKACQALTVMTKKTERARERERTLCLD